MGHSHYDKEGATVPDNVQDSQNDENKPSNGRGLRASLVGFAIGALVQAFFVPLSASLLLRLLPASVSRSGLDVIAMSWCLPAGVAFIAGLLCGIRFPSLRFQIASGLGFGGALVWIAAPLSGVGDWRQMVCLAIVCLLAGIAGGLLAGCFVPRSDSAAADNE